MQTIKHIHHEIGGSGGPSGYLRLLSQAINSASPPDDLRLIVEHLPLEPLSTSNSLSDVSLPSPLRETVICSNDDSRVARYLRAWLNRTRRMLEQISDSSRQEIFGHCDLLVVHNVFAAARILELWPLEARDKVVLMTHSPTPLTKEIISSEFCNLPEEELDEHPLVRALVSYETSVMQNVRTVLWPCEESQEGYSDWYEQFKSGAARAIFAETGVIRPTTNGITAEVLRRQWEVSPGQRTVLFIGRPHRHKGFETFLNFACSLRHEQSSKWVFIHAGQQPSPHYDISPIRHIGFQRSQGALYKAADLVMIPNRFSYFDIGALEAISMGARLAISSSGGHKLLLRACPTLPSIPSDLKSPKRLLEEVQALYDTNPARVETFQQCWSRRFTLHHFVANHIHAFRKLLEMKSS